MMTVVIPQFRHMRRLFAHDKYDIMTPGDFTSDKTQDVLEHISTARDRTVVSRIKSWICLACHFCHLCNYIYF